MQGRIWNLSSPVVVIRCFVLVVEQAWGRGEGVEGSSPNFTYDIMVVTMLKVNYPSGRILCKEVSHTEIPCQGFFLKGN